MTARGILLDIKGDINELEDVSGVIINDMMYSSHYYLKEQYCNNLGTLKGVFCILLPNTKIDYLHKFEIGQKITIVE